MQCRSYLTCVPCQDAPSRRGSRRTLRAAARTLEMCAMPLPSRPCACTAIAWQTSSWAITKVMQEHCCWMDELRSPCRNTKDCMHLCKLCRSSTKSVGLCSGT